MMIFVAMVACRGDPDIDLALLGDEEVAAVFPPDGSLRVWGDVPVQVVFGAAADPASVEVTLRRDEVVSQLPCSLLSGGAVAACGVVPGVAAGEEITIDVRVSGTRQRSQTEARLPDPGLGWSLLDGVEITALGSGSAAADLASDQLTRGEMFAALDGYDGTPGTWTFMISPSGAAEDGNAAISPWGFGFLLPVTVASDGRMWGRADNAWLSTQVGSNAVAMLLLDVRLDAQLVGADLVDLTLEAAAPTLTLEALSSALGGLSAFLDLVKLDVDRNSDGVYDAASIRLEGAPASAELRAWQQ
jgi:hypothetical protein